jgi:mono/diheme cytochrome c family protein
VKRTVATIGALGALLCCSLSTAAQQPARSTSTAPITAGPQATLQQYCVTCHNSRLKAGNLAIDQLDIAHLGRDAESWEKVVRKLRVGAMPPRGARRPDATAANALIAWLESELDGAGTDNPGRPTLRRLNRAEYANAIRDLLALDVDVTSLLPPDGAAFGFDNVADAQGSSPALLQAYLAAARKISAVAVGDSRIGIGSDTYTARQDLSQDVHLDGLPLGTVGGLRATHTFPLDGEYEFQVRLYRTNLSAMRGLEDPQEVELTVDGERFLSASIGGDKDLIALQTNPTDTSDTIEATRLRVRRFVKAGQRDVAAAFIEKTSPTFETHRLQRFIRDFANPFDAEGAPHVLSIGIQGPFNAKGAQTPPSPRIFTCTPANAAEEASCARRILSALASRAYRRPVSSTETMDLMSSFEQGRSNGSFKTGVQFGLRRILASPSFVFRPEAEPAAIATGTAYRVTDLELASRLSFFLWSSIPDEELLRVAREGRLSQPATLRVEMRRMLADPRSSAFINNFAGQWLHLRNLRSIIPNSDLFPDFDDNLRQAFRREAELFFESVLRENRSVLDLMTADYTFVNERLARHYGLGDVFGSGFRRVQLKDAARYGLLGKGAILLATSHPTTTSPVLRGKWVLENIVGTPPPAPPANLDTALKTDPPGSAPSTMRAQMERHRTSPVCANCHQTMDPIGFALENFDVVGKWRTEDQAGLSLDTADVMTDGTTINGVTSLRQVLMRRPDVFVQTLTEKLLIYALGRGLTAEDMPVVRKIVRDAGQQQYRFRALLEGIVDSAAFQMRLKVAGASQQAVGSRQ